jgi:hypothetical protein
MYLWFSCRLLWWVFYYDCLPDYTASHTKIQKILRIEDVSICSLRCDWLESFTLRFLSRTVNVYVSQTELLQWKLLNISTKPRTFVSVNTVYSYPIIGPDRPSDAPRISKQSAHEGGKVVSPTHRPSLPPEKTPGTHFCQRLSLPQGHSATGRIKSLKNSSDSIGNRTRSLPACSAVPQPTAPLHTPFILCTPCISCWAFMTACKETSFTQNEAPTLFDL